MPASSGRFARPVNRNAADRFVGEGDLRDEERAALRVAILSTCRRDRSAAEAVAAEVEVERGTVYDWIEGRVKSNPLRQLCLLLDGCIAGKGEDSAAALAPARLIYARYLAPAAAPGLPSLHHGAALLREAGDLITAWGSFVDGCSTPEEAREVVRECRELRAKVDAAEGMAVALLQRAGEGPVRVEVR